MPELREIYEQMLANEIYVGLSPAEALAAFRCRIPLAIQDKLIEERQLRIDAELKLELARNAA